MSGAGTSRAKQIAKFWLAGLGVNRDTYALQLTWVKSNHESWLSATLKNTIFVPPLTPSFFKIEERADWAQTFGARKLWEGYGQDGAVRDCESVRTKSSIGTFYSWLVMRRRPKVIVEFGAAFGVSGMYWLAGLEKTQTGRLYSYEPNADWAEIARQNLDAIGTRFTLTNGTFEDNVDRTLLRQKIDIAFVDAIHTSEFVEPQFRIIASRLEHPGLIILDDIDFSDDMRSCWQRLARGPEVRASLEVGSHIGIIEIA